MSTGYTCKVQDGSLTDPKLFILQCARAFGACIIQRDDDGNDLPKLQPDEEEDSYYVKALAETLETYKKYSKKSNKRFAAIRIKELKEELTRYYEYLVERVVYKERYEKMLTGIEKWVPPTEDHKELANFAKKQLEESIDFDCSLNYWVKNIQEKKDAIANYDVVLDRAEFFADLKRSIAYYKENLNKDTNRTKERNQWIIDLYTSLNYDDQWITELS